MHNNDDDIIYFLLRRVTHNYVFEDLSLMTTSMSMYYWENMSSKVSNNYEAFASELLDSLG